MSFHLVCTVHVGPYSPGDIVKDQSEVARLTASHDSHFVRVVAPEEPEAEAQPPALPAVEFVKKQ